MKLRKTEKELLFGLCVLIISPIIIYLSMIIIAYISNQILGYTL